MVRRKREGRGWYDTRQGRSATHRVMRPCPHVRGARANASAAPRLLTREASAHGPGRRACTSAPGAMAFQAGPRRRCGSGGGDPRRAAREPGSETRRGTPPARTDARAPRRTSRRTRTERMLRGGPEASLRARWWGEGLPGGLGGKRFGRGWGRSVAGVRQVCCAQQSGSACRTRRRALTRALSTSMWARATAPRSASSTRSSVVMEQSLDRVRARLDVHRAAQVAAPGPTTSSSDEPEAIASGAPRAIASRAGRRSPRRRDAMQQAANRRMSASTTGPRLGRRAAHEGRSDPSTLPTRPADDHEHAGCDTRADLIRSIALTIVGRSLRGSTGRRSTRIRPSMPTLERASRSSSVRRGGHVDAERRDLHGRREVEAFGG